MKFFVHYFTIKCDIKVLGWWVTLFIVWISYREPDNPKGNMFWCKYCTLQCSSQIDFDTHCSGKSHAKKLKVHQVLGIKMNETTFPKDSINVADISQALNPTTYCENATYRYFENIDQLRILKEPVLQFYWITY